MRISELSRRSGASVPTIKFYLREGLLPPGTPTARNQADYDERHLRRIRLIRTFTGLAGLDLSSVRELLVAVDDERVPMADLYEVLNRIIAPADPQPSAPPGIEQANAQAEVDGFLKGLGWQHNPGSTGPAALARVLAALRGLGCDADIDFFAPFAAAAALLARVELDLLPPEVLKQERGAAVVRSVLFDAVFAALRRMAHEHQVLTGLSDSSPRR
ncbi:MerR family transcriptional regulator [Micromonospora sp. NPDC003944]